VHTDVGNQAVAARIDGKLVPLRTRLASGQRVEIITARSSAPKPQWLEFVVSGKARTSIRQQLKHIEHEDAVQIGHRMLDRALEELESSLERLPTQRLEAYLHEHRYPRLEALLADIALGMLRNALDAFARLDLAVAAKVVRQDEQVDQAFASILRQLITFMMEDPRTISHAIEILFIAKAIERIGDHSKNMSEYVVYLVKGKDVRHITVEAFEREALG